MVDVLRSMVLDKNGQLDYSKEFKVMIREVIGIEVNDDIIQAMLVAVDKNCDGSIDFLKVHSSCLLYCFYQLTSRLHVFT